MSLKESLITYEEIESMPEGYELVEWRLKELALAGGKQGFREQEVVRDVDERFEKEGFVPMGEAGLDISRNPPTVRGADIVFVSKEKLKELPIVLIDPYSRKITLIDEERRISIRSFEEELEFLESLKIKPLELLGGSG